MEDPPDTEDERRLTALFDRHRRELPVHRHRMPGSSDQAEDTVRDAFLRGWLHRITTNACLTFGTGAHDALGLPERLP